MKYKTKRKAQAQQKGVGMMEVLIALLVLSIGILGLATLQSIGLKFNHQSYQRTQAIMHVYDIADRIRSNATSKTTAYDSAIAGSSAAGVDCTTDVCSGTQRAVFDLHRWRLSLVNLLGPDAEGGVTRIAGTRLHRIQVDWMENDVRKSFVYETQLI